MGVAKYTNENFSGTKLGSLTAICFSHRVRNSVAYWVFRCDCGEEKTIELSSVIRGQATSCGCYFRDFIAHRNSKHGHSKSTRHGASPTYLTWASMIQRCKEDPTYTSLGVCDRWRDFKNFLYDMVERPSNKTLDRIDGNKGYYKENCRWATKVEQSQNKRKVKKTSSQYKGVHKVEESKWWVANIQAQGKKYKLGKYKTEEEAALAYNNAAKELHGKFAVLNIIR